MCFRYPLRYQPKVTANLVFGFDIKPKPKLFSVVSISIIQAVLSWDKISDRHTASSNQAQIVSEDPFSIAPLRNATTLSFAGGTAGKGLCATYWKNTMQGRWILGIRGGGTVFWMGFYVDISWESRCCNEIKVSGHWCKIFVVFEVPAWPLVKWMSIDS